MIEILFELILQLFGEVLVDLIIHAIGSADREAKRLIRIVVYALLGAIVGAISILIFPTHMIRSAPLRWVALVLIPLFAGAVFAMVGRSRDRRGKPVSALETFMPAYAFALAMAVVRHFAAD